MDSTRAERLRYFVPGVYLALSVALVFFDPIFSSTQVTTGTSVFVLGAGSLVGGFVANRLASIPKFRNALGLRSELERHGNEIVADIITDHLNQDQSLPTEIRRELKGYSSQIFDEFINEKCSEKAVDRFFYLNDMESGSASLSLISMGVAVTGLRQSICSLHAGDFFTVGLLAYAANAVLVFHFAASTRYFFVAARRYSVVLVLSYFDEIQQHVKEISQSRLNAGNLRLGQDRHG